MGLLVSHAAQAQVPVPFLAAIVHSAWDRPTQYFVVWQRTCLHIAWTKSMLIATVCMIDAELILSFLSHESQPCVHDRDRYADNHCAWLVVIYWVSDSCNGCVLYWIECSADQCLLACYNHARINSDHHSAPRGGALCRVWVEWGSQPTCPHPSQPGLGRSSGEGPPALCCSPTQ